MTHSEHLAPSLAWGRHGPGLGTGMRAGCLPDNPIHDFHAEGGDAPPVSADALTAPPALEVLPLMETVPQKESGFRTHLTPTFVGIGVPARAGILADSSIGAGTPGYPGWIPVCSDLWAIRPLYAGTAGYPIKNHTGTRMDTRLVPTFHEEFAQHEATEHQNR